MSSEELNWKHPPVVEVLAGVQFDPLPSLCNGDLGLFWHDLRDAYPAADDAPPIPLIVDSFSHEPTFGVPGIALRAAGGDSRLRMRSRDGGRMVQVQNGWLLANWMRRGESDYPGFTGVLKQFSDAIARFRSFLETRQIKPLRPTVWEVTYIDHIPSGPLWTVWSEVPTVIPGLLGVPGSAAESIQSVSGAWGFGLRRQHGRMEVSVQTARTASERPVDLIVVRTTARGPISDGTSVEAALNQGSREAVEMFMSITSDDAKKFWRG